MITILGASGFVGSNLVDLLIKKNISYYAPNRNEIIDKRPLGDVIYCIGTTANFRIKPFETVEAHVCKLKNVLETCQFDSFIYLSSTRLYLKSIASEKRITESDNICLNTDDIFDLFAASKITGELLALNSCKPNIKIVRLSNVFGNDFHSNNFITSIVKDAIRNKKVELYSTPDSEKDYIAIMDACNALLLLSKIRESGVYNLAFGKNTTNEAILNEISRLTGAKISYSTKAKKFNFTEIDNTKLSKKINFYPRKTIIEALPEIVASFKEIL